MILWQKIQLLNTVIVIRKTFIIRLLRLSIYQNLATDKPTCKCSRTLGHYVMCFTHLQEKQGQITGS